MSVALKARPTTYNGIEMRSRLEARVAAFLDACEVKWEYEPRAFASGRAQYLPDFRTEITFPFTGETRPVYIEVKPGRDGSEAAWERMSVVWQSEPQALLALIQADFLESAGWFFYRYQNGGGGMAAFVKCRHCDWPSFGHAIALSRFLDDQEPLTLYHLCPLCDRWSLAGESEVVHMPEWDAPTPKDYN